MTSKKYAHKRIGFLAATQSFHDGTDVLMLTTNMLKKVRGVVVLVMENSGLVACTRTSVFGNGDG